MLDHIGFPVSDFARAKAFYVAALAPLGVDLMMELTAEQTGGSAHAGFGSDGKPYFWIGGAKAAAMTVHIAFAAAARAQVDAFYAAAMAAGGTDNGPPGPRVEYSPDYYAAFVLDPDGNNIEAMCRAPV